MILNGKLYDLFEKKAQQVMVDTLCIGLGYTVVTTSDGGIGISYTYFMDKSSCSMNKNYVDYEGEPAIRLLEKIKSADPIQRSTALALINALNYEKAVLLPEDRTQDILFETLGIGKGTRVAMVGFFGPMMKHFNKREASVTVMDENRRLGVREDFYKHLKESADVLVLTSTSILNNTTEEILEHAGVHLKTVMLGPSTPMVADAFDHLPVHLLAGTAPIKKNRVLKAIRHGFGTPVIQKFSKKTYLVIS